MSFILDALKKSESERQRQNGPALFEVKVAPPRHRFAIWAVALGALLAINLVVVGWLLSHGSSARSAGSVPAAPAPAIVAAAAVLRSSAPAPVSKSPAPANPAASPVASPHTRALAAATPAATGGAGDAGSAPVNPADLAPAVEPPRGSPVPDSGGSVVRESGLPTYQDAAAVPGANIPPLRLDLHVYSAVPGQRFVFLNLMKLHEGDSLPQGVRVDAITPDGVILSYRGTQFVLQRQ